MQTPITKKGMSMQFIRYANSNDLPQEAIERNTFALQHEMHRGQTR